MAARPEWTSSLLEWAVLRDQLISTARPDTLSRPERASIWIVILACLANAVLFGFAACSSLARALRHASARRDGQARRLSALARAALSDIGVVLPLILAVHAVLNLASISSFLKDSGDLKFRGNNDAVQQFNFSLLLCAGLILSWGTLYGLSPFDARKYKDFDAPVPKWMQNLTPSGINTIGSVSSSISIVLPLPWIISSVQNVKEMNRTTWDLVSNVNQVIQSELRPGSERLVDEALRKINDLDESLSELYRSTRTLAGIHVALIFFCLTIWISVSIPTLTNWKRRSQKLAMRETVTDAEYGVTEDDLTRRSIRIIPYPHQSSLTQVDPSRPPLRSPEDVMIDARTDNDFQIMPNPFDSHDHLQDSISFSKPKSSPASFDSIIEPRSRQSAIKRMINDSRFQILKIKLSFIVVTLASISYLLLNFFIVTDAFKFPDRISMGELMILRIKWSSWTWNGSLGFICSMVQFYHCTKKTKR